MKNIPEECIETVKHPKIVLKEKKSRIVFLNKQRKKIQKIHIDDCVLKEGKKCDWMLLTDKQYEYFIELKGQHISEAVKQLENTIYQLSDNLKKQQRISFIITHIRPKMGPKIQILKSKFRKKFKSELIVQNSPYTTNI